MHHLPRSFSWLRALAGAGVLTLGALALTGCLPADPNAACIPGAPPAGVTCAAGDTCNAVQLSAGGNGTCAVVGPSTQCRDAAGVLTPSSDGTCAAGSTAVYVGSEVRCWGQLNTTLPPSSSPATGTGTPSPAGARQTNTPTTIQIGAQATSGAQLVRLYRQVVVGPNGHTCAVDVGGRVSCWGAEGAGPPIAYRDPQPAVRAEQAVVVPIDRADEVAIGDEHACARIGVQARCWGRSGAEFTLGDASGQVHRVTTGINGAARTREEVLLPLSGITQLTAGARHTCALTSDGSVWCWSSDQSDASLGNAPNGTFAVQVMLRAATPGAARQPLANVKALGAGGTHTCAIVEATSGGQRSVYCWGTNASGELGVADSTATTATLATGLGDTSSLRQVAAGRSHTCVLAGGVVVCWGANTSGQCGVAVSPTVLPTQVPGITDAAELTAGNDHTCVRLRSGEVRCWGGNVQGQLGLRTNVSPVATPPTAGSLCCQAGAGACASGCINLQTDNQNCGACGRACASGQQCVAGTCQAATPVGACTVSACGTALTSCLADRPCAGWYACWAACTDDACREACANTSMAGASAVTTCAQTPCGAVLRGHRLAAGGEHTCVIRRSAASLVDEVVCWGPNGFDRQLGVADAGRCEAVPGLPDAVEVVAGYEFSCVRRASGAIQCWGSVNDPPTTTDVVEIAAGFAHACARLSDGTVRCWGSDRSGQLGFPRGDPLPVAGLTGVVEIAAGAFHSCARRSDGTVHCWGSNSSNQLGREGAGGFMSMAVVGLAGVVEIAAGTDHTCARLGTGEVRCWGANGSNQLGREGMGGATPMAVAGLTGVVEIAAGRNVTCAITGADRNVQCWGAALGPMGTTGGATPRPVLTAAMMPLRDAVEISVGGSVARTHACARLRNGNVVCWGDNGDGRLGVATTTAASATAVQSVCTPGCAATAAAMMPAAATTTTCALTCVDTQTNSAHCGGCDNACSDGLGCVGGRCAQAPTMCMDPTTLCGGGADARCVDLQTHPANCGRCDNACTPGQVCVGGSCASGTPTRLAAGDGHTCEVVAGAVRCWGSDAFGQRGDGTPVSSLVCSGPTLDGVVEIAAGLRHTCARLQSGEVRCWGANYLDQLGNDTTTPSATPVAVVVPAAMMGGTPTNLTGVVEIAAGSNHTCARLQSGEVRCWGANGSGQLGSGATAERGPPVAVTGLPGTTDPVVEIAAGWRHTCARLQSGEVRCWGDNSDRQLGNGMDVPSLTPVAVVVPAATMGGTPTNLTGVVEIAAGFRHTCARLQSGEVRCWGLNNNGQLGNAPSGTDGRYTPRNSSVPLVATCTAANTSCAMGTTACGTNCCSMGQECQNGTTCVTRMSSCMAGQMACPSGCVNLQSDTANCGTCGNACVPGSQCTAGRCVRCPDTGCGTTVTCTASQQNCGGVCVNTQTHNANCGGCGRSCPPGQVCAGGMCGTTCTAPTPTLCGATCVNTQTDPDHCGTCTTVCAAGMNAARSCASGVCGLLCNSGFRDCTAAAGCETNIQTSLANCGGCGTACPTLMNGTAACAGGSCGLASCNTGFGNCDGNAMNGCEVNTNTNPSNCGMCGTTCTVPSNGTATCVSGACGVACNTGRTNCSGVCADLQTDAARCGSCTTACSAGQVCLAGVCTLSCGSQTNCSGSCVNLNTDTNHCGACPTVCAAPSNGGTVACTAGSCVPSCPAGTHLVGTGSGAACVAPGGPHLVAPLSLGDTTQTQPAFRWTNVAGSNGARLEVCADRACTTVVQTLTASGSAATPVTTATPTAPLTRMTLPARTFFWRATAMVGTTVDTGNTSPVWLFHTPRTNRGTVQTSVRPHLDVNGDGLDDIALGAPAAGTGAGRVDVYLGVSTGLPTAVHRTFAGVGTDAFGTSVAPAGDVNGDGFGDLVVGAPGASSGRGAFSLYLGSATGLGPTASVTQPGVAVGDAFARVVVGVGDVDRDGYADLVVGAPGASSGSGAAEWFRGAASFASMRGAALTSSSAPNGQFGLTLANAGDVNGDGYSDVVIGEPGYNSGQGRMHVALGAVTGLPAIPTRIDGGSVGDRFTEGLAGAGDVNADGFSDVVAAAPFALGGNVGGFNMFVGSATGLSTVSVPAGNVSNAGWGRSLAGAGDVDGDGRDDLVIAAPFEASRAGHVYLVSGPALIAAGIFGFPARLFEQTGSAVSAALGASVAGLGDVNGDGFADIAFGAPGESADSRGVVFVLRGAMASFTPPATTFVTAAVTGDRLGAAIASPDAIVPSAAPACSPATQTRCSGACVDLLTSATNCGACGNACATGQTCTAGVCGGGMSCTPSTQCRAAAGGCDVAETCTPGGTCPADGFVMVSVECRAEAAGGCDVAETCTGTSAACPADGFRPSTTVCRTAAAGGCDVPETCTGSGAACPADGFRPSSFVCAAADTATCLAAATCPGSGATCPSRATTCASGETCMAGVCAGSCGSGTTACGSGCCTASQTCLSSQCRVLNLASGAATTRVGDTASGASITAFGSPVFDCPAGMVLTEIDGILVANFSPPSGNFRSLWGVCSTVVLGPGPTVSLGVGGMTATAGRAAPSMGFPFITACPSGQAAIGIDVGLGSEGYPAAVRLRCAPLTATMSGGGFVVGHGSTVTPSPWVGPDVMFGGDPSTSTIADCTGADAFAAGIAGVTFDDGGFTGARNNALGLGCRTATITP